jgi:riboflavin-specific deaminase-like protein
MVGLRTILIDDPKLTVRSHRARKLWRIILDSNARTPLDTYVIKTASETPTIIAVTSQAPEWRVRALRNAGVTLLKCGSGPRVSLTILLRRLKQIGIRSVLLEGGGQLNWSMLSLGLVDEITVAISPVILGGAGAVTLVEGEGSESIGKAVRLRLLRSKSYGRDLVLRYKVLHQTSRLV